MNSCTNLFLKIHCQDKMKQEKRCDMHLLQISVYFLKMCESSYH